MAKFNIDLTKAQDIKPLPTGVYALKIVDVDPTKTSKAGNAKMVIKSEVLAPASVAADQKFCWHSLSLVESALFKVKQLWEACGLPIKAGGIDTADLLNRQYGAVVILETTPEYGTRNQYTQYLKIQDTKPEVKQQ